MNAGNYNKYITIKRAVQITGAHNEVINTFSDLESVWAQRITPTGKEIRQGKYGQLDKIIWKIRNTDITNDDQIEFNSLTYKIETVIEENNIHNDLIVTTTLNK